MSEPSPVRIQDVLNYKIETYITDEDRQLIKEHFKDNPALLRVVRKVFMPTLSDPSLPVEEMSKDLWFSGIDFATLSKDEAFVRILAKQEAIKFVAGGVMSLKQIANIKEEDPNVIEARRAKDSAK